MCLNEYQKIVLTDVMEIYIIELPKFEKYKEKTQNNALNLWMKFINNPGVMKMEEANMEIKQAKKVLEEISNAKRERYLAELRQKYIMDQKAIEDAGFDKGVKVGVEHGISLGKKQNSLEIARKLKEQNIAIDIINKATGLSIDEIKNLK